jgi:hypothetical protein
MEEFGGGYLTKPRNYIFENGQIMAACRETFFFGLNLGMYVSWMVPLVPYLLANWTKVVGKKKN